MDFSYKYTRKRNSECGRKGYFAWKREKEENIPPADYGTLVINDKKHKKRGIFDEIS